MGDHENENHEGVPKGRMDGKGLGIHTLLRSFVAQT